MFVVILLINNYYKGLEKVYSTAEIIAIHPAVKQDVQVKFRFYYQNRPYVKSHGKGYSKAKVGEKYLVEIPKSNIRMAKILFDIPVPDTLQAPFDGWMEIPEFLERNQ